MISLWLMLVGVCAKCGSAICKICRTLRHVPALLLRRRPGAAPSSSPERRFDSEGELRVELVPGNVVVREGGQLDAVAGTPRYAAVDS